MGRIINLPIHCSCKPGGGYIAYFEEKTPGEWYGIRAERLPVVSYAERKKLERQEKTKRFSLRSLFGSSPKETANNTAKQTSDSSETVNGTFYTGVLKCPDCGNTDFVKCGNCSELTCYDGSGFFTCAVCGNYGEVSGSISDLNGNMSDGNDNTLKERVNTNPPQNSGNGLRWK